MKARDVMTGQPVWCCRENATAREAAAMMAEHDVGAIAACDDEGKVTGIVTDRDICCRLVAKGGRLDTAVREIMSSDVQCCTAETDLETVETIMRTKKIRRVPVVDSDRYPKGFISLSDIAHHCRSPEQEHEFMQVLDTICTP
ncbi:MAG: CBS domain-containing protein [Planctomycetota bacterium]|jgi:CBS domain-containing protein